MELGRVYGRWEVVTRTGGGARIENVWLEEGTPSGVSKELNHAVSLLFATLAGRSISVAAKELTGEFLEAWQGTLGKRGG
jgi:hypothetical protein